MTEITQADRDAAADWLADEFGQQQPFLNKVRHGQQYETLIEAFARHRTAYQGRVERLAEALAKIAEQKLPDELGNPAGADWIGGYEACVQLARAALSTAVDGKD